MSHAQILRLQDRIRQTLLQLRSELDSPAVKAIARVLEEEEGSRVGEPLARLRNALVEVIEAAETSSREVTAELARFSGESRRVDGDELPPGLARFVAERSSFPGFIYEIRNDPLRGRTVAWRETLADGSVRASGLLYERPHGWFHD